MSARDPGFFWRLHFAWIYLRVLKWEWRHCWQAADNYAREIASGFLDYDTPREATAIEFSYMTDEGDYP